MAPTQEQVTLYNYIPDELKTRSQWVCYTLEPNRDGDLTKIPREPRLRARARINKPETFADFAEAVHYVRHFDGIEYMLLESDPYTLIDLDDCFDPETNKLYDWARRIVNRFNTYTEVSQSGRGIHIIARGSKPRRAGEEKPRCSNKKEYPGIEIYDSARPIVMTGNVFEDKTTIEKCGNEIGWLYRMLFGSEEDQTSIQQSTFHVPGECDNNDQHDQSDQGNQSKSRSRSKSRSKSTSTSKSKPESTSTHDTNEPLSDQEIISRALACSKTGDSFARLYAGDKSDYNNDDSAADLALCNKLAFWTRKDKTQMDRLFRNSGLMRAKWDSPRPGGGTYGKNTINRAIVSTPNIYDSAYNLAHDSAHDPTHNRNRNQQSESQTHPTKLNHLTDLGNAEYMISEHGHSLLFDVDSARWLHWCGTHWHRDDIGEIDRIARKTVRGFYDLLKRERDTDKAKSLFNHIKKSESLPRLEAMVKLARYCPGIPVRTSDLDADHWLLNCQNGTVDLRTGKLQSHTQSDKISKIIPIDYDSQAQCPRWHQFLREVFCGVDDLVDFTRRMVGYCLTGDTREESIFILYGRGQCGKSKFIDTLRYILSDYIKDTPVTTFLERNDTNSADLASLVGARLVTASEAEENQAFNEPLLKRISGRDPITCRYLYQNYFTYVPTYKVLFATNDVPKIRSQSFAMKRRIKILPFKQRFYDPEDNMQPVKDDQLQEKLLAEAPGILAWAVQGCLEWQQQGLATPPVIKREIAAIFDSHDPLGEFIDTECVVNANELIQVTDLWKAYKQWCEDNNQPLAVKAPQWFSKNLCQRDGIQAVRGINGARMLQGISLKTDANDANQGSFEKSLHEEKFHEYFPEPPQIASFASPQEFSPDDWEIISDEDDEI